jgi:hypothetical protein
MAVLMIGFGVGSRWSMVWGVACLLSGLSGCFSAEEETAPTGSKASGPAAQASVERPREEPEQVTMSNRARAGSARAAESASAGEAQTVSIGIADPRVRAEEPITSKHLEAELNRLEAELGR